jgi:hypothetical protein
MSATISDAPLNRGLYADSGSKTTSHFPTQYKFPNIELRKYKPETEKRKVLKPKDEKPPYPPKPKKDDDGGELYWPEDNRPIPTYTPEKGKTLAPRQKPGSLRREAFPAAEGGARIGGGDSEYAGSGDDRTPFGSIDWAEHGFARYEPPSEVKGIGRGRGPRPGLMGTEPLQGLPPGRPKEPFEQPSRANSAALGGRAAPKGLTGRPQEPFEQPGTPPRSPLSGGPTRAGIGRGTYKGSAGVDMSGHTRMGEADGNALFVPTNRSGGAREQGWAGSSTSSEPTTVQGYSWEQAKAPRVGAAPVRKALTSDPGVREQPVWDNPAWIRKERGPARDPHEFETKEMQLPTYDAMERLRSMGSRGSGRTRQRRGSTTTGGTKQSLLHQGVGESLRNVIAKVSAAQETNDVSHMADTMTNRRNGPKRRYH